MKKNNRSSTDKPLILIIDDDGGFLESMGEFLKERDCRVDLASTGKVALKKLGKQKYDLAIIDGLLNDMEGVQVIKIVRNGGVGVTNRRIPFIFVTGGSLVDILLVEYNELQPISYFRKLSNPLSILESMLSLIDNPTDKPN
jgi:CheY-like chemotaxis protein